MHKHFRIYFPILRAMFFLSSPLLLITSEKNFFISIATEQFKLHFLLFSCSSDDETTSGHFCYLRLWVKKMKKLSLRIQPFVSMQIVRFFTTSNHQRYSTLFRKNKKGSQTSVLVFFRSLRKKVKLGRNVLFFTTHANHKKKWRKNKNRKVRCCWTLLLLLRCYELWKFIQNLFGTR